MKITARYAGKCRACRGTFPAGTEIEWAKGAGARHLGCAGHKLPAGGTAAEAARGVGNGGAEVYEVRTSGGTFYRNREGLCEDAPCCGCCTF